MDNLKINTSVMLSEIEASFARDLSTSLKVTIFKLLDYKPDKIATLREPTYLGSWPEVVDLDKGREYSYSVYGNL